MVAPTRAPDLFIDTKRLRIRPWSESDCDVFLQLAGDVGYTAFSVPGQFALDPAGAMRAISERIEKFQNRGTGKFPVFDIVSGEILGTCGLDTYTLDSREEFELGYRLRLSAWGKGYATEAAAAILRYGFRDLKLARIIAFALPQNRASLQVLKRLGFRYEKTFSHAGLPHDLYAMSAEQFAADTVSPI